MNKISKPSLLNPALFAGFLLDWVQVDYSKQLELLSLVFIYALVIIDAQYLLLSMYSKEGINLPLLIKYIKHNVRTLMLLLPLKSNFFTFQLIIPRLQCKPFSVDCNTLSKYLE